MATIVLDSSPTAVNPTDTAADGSSAGLTGILSPSQNTADKEKEKRSSEMSKSPTPYHFSSPTVFSQQYEAQVPTPIVLLQARQELLEGGPYSGFTTIFGGNNKQRKLVKGLCQGGYQQYVNDVAVAAHAIGGIEVPPLPQEWPNAFDIQQIMDAAFHAAHSCDCNSGVTAANGASQQEHTVGLAALYRFAFAAGLTGDRPTWVGSPLDERDSARRADSRSRRRSSVFGQKPFGQPETRAGKSAPLSPTDISNVYTFVAQRDHNGGLPIEIFWLAVLHCTVLAYPNLLVELKRQKDNIRTMSGGDSTNETASTGATLSPRLGSPAADHLFEASQLLDASQFLTGDSRRSSVLRPSSGLSTAGGGGTSPGGKRTAMGVAAENEDHTPWLIMALLQHVCCVNLSHVTRLHTTTFPFPDAYYDTVLNTARVVWRYSEGLERLFNHYAQDTDKGVSFDEILRFSSDFGIRATLSSEAITNIFYSCASDVRGGRRNPAFLAPTLSSMSSADSPGAGADDRYTLSFDNFLELLARMGCESLSDEVFSRWKTLEAKVEHFLVSTIQPGYQALFDVPLPYEETNPPIPSVSACTPNTLLPTGGRITVFGSFFGALGRGVWVVTDLHPYPLHLEPESDSSLSFVVPACEGDQWAECDIEIDESPDPADQQQQQSPAGTRKRTGSLSSGASGGKPTSSPLRPTPPGAFPLPVSTKQNAEPPPPPPSRQLIGICYRMPLRIAVANSPDDLPFLNDKTSKTVAIMESTLDPFFISSDTMAKLKHWFDAGCSRSSVFNKSYLYNNGWRWLCRQLSLFPGKFNLRALGFFPKGSHSPSAPLEGSGNDGLETSQRGESSLPVSTTTIYEQVAQFAFGELASQPEWLLTNLFDSFATPRRGESAARKSVLFDEFVQLMVRIAISYGVPSTAIESQLLHLLLGRGEEASGQVPTSTSSGDSTAATTSFRRKQVTIDDGDGGKTLPPRKGKRVESEGEAGGPHRGSSIGAPGSSASREEALIRSISKERQSIEHYKQTHGVLKSKIESQQNTLTKWNEIHTNCAKSLSEMKGLLYLLLSGGATPSPTSPTRVRETGFDGSGSRLGTPTNNTVQRNVSPLRQSQQPRASVEAKLGKGLSEFYKKSVFEMCDRNVTLLTQELELRRNSEGGEGEEGTLPDHDRRRSTLRSSSTDASSNAVNADASFNVEGFKSMVEGILGDAQSRVSAASTLASVSGSPLSATGTLRAPSRDMVDLLTAADEKERKAQARVRAVESELEVLQQEAEKKVEKLEAELKSTKTEAVANERSLNATKFQLKERDKEMAKLKTLVDRLQRANRAGATATTTAVGGLFGGGNRRTASGSGSASGSTTEDFNRSQTLNSSTSGGGPLSHSTQPGATGPTSTGATAKRPSTISTSSSGPGTVDSEPFAMTTGGIQLPKVPHGKGGVSAMRRRSSTERRAAPPSVGSAGGGLASTGGGGGGGGTHPQPALGASATSAKDAASIRLQWLSTQLDSANEKLSETNAERDRWERQYREKVVEFETLEKTLEAVDRWAQLGGDPSSLRRSLAILRGLPPPPEEEKPPAPSLSFLSTTSAGEGQSETHSRQNSTVESDGEGVKSTTMNPPPPPAVPTSPAVVSLSALSESEAVSPTLASKKRKKTTGGGKMARTKSIAGGSTSVTSQPKSSVSSSLPTPAGKGLVDMGTSPPPMDLSPPTIIEVPKIVPCKKCAAMKAKVKQVNLAAVQVQLNAMLVKEGLNRLKSSVESEGEIVLNGMNRASELLGRRAVIISRREEKWIRDTIQAQVQAQAQAHAAAPPAPSSSKQQPHDRPTGGTKAGPTPLGQARRERAGSTSSLTGSSKATPSPSPSTASSVSQRSRPPEREREEEMTVSLGASAELRSSAASSEKEKVQATAAYVRFEEDISSPTQQTGTGGTGGSEGAKKVGSAPLFAVKGYQPPTTTTSGGESPAVSTVTPQSQSLSATESSGAFPEGNRGGGGLAPVATTSPGSSAYALRPEHEAALQRSFPNSKQFDAKEPTSPVSISPSARALQPSSSGVVAPVEESKLPVSPEEKDLLKPQQRKTPPPAAPTGGEEQTTFVTAQRVQLSSGAKEVHTPTAHKAPKEAGGGLLLKTQQQPLQAVEGISSSVDQGAPVQPHEGITSLLLLREEKGQRPMEQQEGPAGGGVDEESAGGEAAPPRVSPHAPTPPPSAVASEPSQEPQPQQVVTPRADGLALPGTAVEPSTSTKFIATPQQKPPSPSTQQSAGSTLSILAAAATVPKSTSDAPEQGGIAPQPHRGVLVPVTPAAVERELHSPQAVLIDSPSSLLQSQPQPQPQPDDGGSLRQEPTRVRDLEYEDTILAEAFGTLASGGTLDEAQLARIKGVIGQSFMMDGQNPFAGSSLMESEGFRRLVPAGPPTAGQRPPDQQQQQQTAEGIDGVRGRTVLAPTSRNVLARHPLPSTPQERQEMWRLVRSGIEKMHGICTMSTGEDHQLQESMAVVTVKDPSSKKKKAAGEVIAVQRNTSTLQYRRLYKDAEGNVKSEVQAPPLSRDGGVREQALRDLEEQKDRGELQRARFDAKLPGEEEEERLAITAGPTTNGTATGQQPSHLTGLIENSPAYDTSRSKGEQQIIEEISFDALISEAMHSAPALKNRKQTATGKPLVDRVPLPPNLQPRVREPSQNATGPNPSLPVPSRLRGHGTAAPPRGIQRVPPPLPLTSRPKTGTATTTLAGTGNGIGSNSPRGAPGSSSSSPRGVRLSPSKALGRNQISSAPSSQVRRNF